jgi:hypothetical protein
MTEGEINPDGHEALRFGVAGLWRYECRPAAGRCAIDDAVLNIALTLEGVTARPPDVNAVEAWLGELLRTPTTAERVAVEAHARFGFAASVTGHADKHGPITFRVPA